MKALRFYEYFASAYGTCWLLLLLAALVSQSHIDAGAFGMFGFPVLALIYAVLRLVATNHHDEERAREQRQTQRQLRRLEDRLRALDERTAPE